MSSYLKAAQYEPKSPQEQIGGLSYILPLEGRSGFVFALAYLSKKSPDAETVLQILRDHVYRLASSIGNEANAQHRFEQFLGALNETLSQTVKEGRFYIPIQHFHAAVGIISEDQMFLSGAGELTGLFLHKKPSQRYQVFNIFRSIQTEQSLPTWEKPFAVVLDGDLESGDVFCVSQKDLQQAVSADDLNSILTSLPPKSATEKIRQHFPAKDELLLIIIKAEDPNSRITEAHAKPLSDVSIDSFVRSQDETSRLLADQKPNILGFLKTKLVTFYKKHTERSRILMDLKRGESTFKTILGVIKTTGRFIARIAKRILKQTTLVAQTISKQETREEAIQNFLSQKHHLEERTSAFLQSRHNLPKHKKRTLIVIIGLAVILIIGLVILSTVRARSESERIYRTKVSAIENVIEQAGGAMIYKDENQARTLYANAMTLLHALPTDTPDRAQTAKKITSDIETSMNELRHIVTIPNPVLAANLSMNTNSPSGTAIVTIGSELFVSGSDQNIYKLDSTKKIFSLVNPTPITTGSITSLSATDTSIDVLDSTNHLFTVDTKNGSVSPVSVSLDQGRWKTVVAYASRLYLMQSSPDGTDNQILRFDRSGSGFGGGTPWIVSKTDSLQNATAFTLDGSLYILKSSGQIIRFQNGSEVGWELGIVDPPFTNTTKLWTSATSKFMYVLEPATKRVVVFKKDTGAFVSQYKSEVFDHLQDFSVDEKAQTIYLLNGSKLYTITASHLKN